MLRYLLFYLLLCVLPASATAHKATSDEPRTLLVIGDSLSAAHQIALEAGWVALLGERLARGTAEIAPGQWQVVNASVSGETSTGGRARLSALLRQHQPELCIIELGANDGLRGQSLKRLQANLGAMIEQCQTYGQVLLLGIWLPPNYGSQYTQAFRAIWPQLAAQYQVPLVPFLLDGVAGQAQYMQADGLHPNAQGQAIILETVWKQLQALLRAQPAHSRK